MMPKAFSDQERQLIHQRLLEQGSEQFAMHGLRKVTVEELAHAAGISKGAFYLFYPSKEALFLEVVAAAERCFQQEVLAAVDLPGPSPQARLYAVLHQAFTLWKTIPVLRLFTSADYEMLARRVPPEMLETHLARDQHFVQALIARCQAVGIPMQVAPDELDGLLHALFFTSLHEDDFGKGELTDAIELLLKLTAAYCLGDIRLDPHLMVHD
jgi:AcrR family transcriptional regulator